MVTRGDGIARRLMPHDPRRHGEEPDYRFTLANERTFLAWIRTSLALSVGGLGTIALLPDLAGSALLGVALLSLGLLTAASAYRRWADNESSMRRGLPLPVSHLPKLMAAGTALIALGAAVLLVVDRV